MSLLCLLALTGCRKQGAAAASVQSEVPTTQTETQAMIVALDAFGATERSCLWDGPIAMPQRYPAARGERLTGFRSLVEAGLLREEGSPARPAFELTQAGRASWTASKSDPNAGNFCYGTRRVTSVSSVGVANPEIFGPATEVQYEAAYTDVPAWARTAAVRDAFAMVNLELSRPLPHSATLLKREGKWTVVAGPAGAIAEPVGPHTR